MRILHVVGWLAHRYGGTPEAVIQSQRWVGARGHHVDIITTNADGDGVLDVKTGHSVDWHGVAATFHPIVAPKRFLTSWSLLADLRRRVDTYDVVHIHGLYRFHTIAAASAARQHGVPYVLQAHGSLNPPTRARHRRLKTLYHWLAEDSNIRAAARLLVTSPEEEGSIRALGYDVPISVVPLGVDADSLRNPVSPRPFMLLAGIADDAQIVTFIGRLSREKGVDVLVRAFLEMAKGFPRAHLVVAGPDDQGIGRRLSTTIAEANLGGRVSFVGTIGGSDKRALLQRSDVVVLPSTGESFGIAVAEAMAVGAPVIVTTGVPLHSTVTSARAGLVVPRDESHIAGAIGIILSSRDTAAAMGEGGKRAVDSRLTWSRVAADLESMYESVIRAPNVTTESQASGSTNE
jgi:glycosyltransferase involved in cell wall biosynthesis